MDKPTKQAKQTIQFLMFFINKTIQYPPTDGKQQAIYIKEFFR